MDEARLRYERFAEIEHMLEDNNAWWALDCGDHMNAAEDLLAEVRRLGAYEANWQDVVTTLTGENADLRAREADWRSLVERYVVATNACDCADEEEVRLLRARLGLVEAR